MYNVVAVLSVRGYVPISKLLERFQLILMLRVRT